MTFQECCAVCLDNQEFLTQFNRLTGNAIGTPRTGIEIAIDKACGRDPNRDGMKDFCKFVFEFIWLPLCKHSGGVELLILNYINWPSLLHTAQRHKT